MSALAELPQRLLQALAERQPLEKSEGEGIDVSTGYGLQRHGLALREQRGEQLTGWKVAFAGAAVQRKFELAEPVYGALTEVMALENAAQVSLSQLVAPKLEIELALTLGRDLSQDFYTDDEILDAIGHAAPAFEIADCRWQDWGFNAGAFLADNAAAAQYCLGNLEPFDLQRHSQVAFALTHNDLTLGQGRSVAGAESSLSNTCWLIRRLLADGRTLRKGQVILSGALLPPITIEPGRYCLRMLGTQIALDFVTG